MNYLLFSKDILIGNGADVHRIGKDSKDILESIEEASICVVDVDLLIASAVENPIEQKDSILVRKFNEFYQHEPYVIQDERIDHNLFQVMGIKEQMVRDIYSLIPPHKVKKIVPYGVALRNMLFDRKVDLNKTVVFVDDMGMERLLTVFDGYKFSRTRVIVNNGEDILSEIKRSKIDFIKKTSEYMTKKNADFLILVNDQGLAVEINNNSEGLPVEHINVAYPFLEGLKGADTQFQYKLPEEILKTRNEAGFKKKILAIILSGSILAAGLFFFLYNMVNEGFVNDRYRSVKLDHERLNSEFGVLEKEIYRADLRLHKSLNYWIAYLSVLNIIPANYMVNAFKFYKTSHWNLELTLFADGDSLIDPIPRINIMKNAGIRDIFVNNQPGKRLVIAL